MAVLAVIVLTLPLLLDNYWLSLANTAMIAAIGAIGLNILVGYTGQISLGQGGFLAVGAFTSAILTDRLGMPAPVSIIGASRASTWRSRRWRRRW
jgi:branched-chain amino acid transport system permease protein